jgi:hypothetical protein
VSNVWETRYRLLLEQFEQLANQLSDDKPEEPTALEEQALRLLAAAITLLRQHQVNKRGQCNYCGWSSWTRLFWRRRPQCSVYRSLDFAMRQHLDVVLFLLQQRSPDSEAGKGTPDD